MLFNSGNPSLISRTRSLAGNPASEPSTLYPEQDVKDAINLAYGELWSRARSLDVGWGVTSSTIDSVLNQIEYSLPTDLDGKVLSVELQELGTAIAFGIGTTFLRPIDPETGREAYSIGDLTSPTYYYIRGDKFGIISPPAISGTNSIQIYYDQEITYLSGNTDEPLIPKSHRDLICLFASMDLRASKDIGFRDLSLIASRKFPSFIEDLAEPIDDQDNQMTAVGRTARSFRTKVGFIRRV